MQINNKILEKTRQIKVCQYDKIISSKHIFVSLIYDDGNKLIGF